MTQPQKVTGQKAGAKGRVRQSSCGSVRRGGGLRRVFPSFGSLQLHLRFPQAVTWV